MKAFLTGSSVVFAVAALGLLGCDGGGVDEGMPKDAAKAVTPDMQEAMKINMGPAKPADIAKKKQAAEEATKSSGTAK